MKMARMPPQKEASVAAARACLCPACSGQRVAFKQGGHGVGFTGNAQQDGGYRPAVFRTVENSCQHGDAGQWRHDIGEGKEQRHGRRRAEAGQYSYNHAQQHARQHQQPQKGIAAYRRKDLQVQDALRRTGTIRSQRAPERKTVRQRPAQPPDNAEIQQSGHDDGHERRQSCCCCPPRGRQERAQRRWKTASRKKASGRARERRPVQARSGCSRAARRIFPSWRG